MKTRMAWAAAALCFAAGQARADFATAEAAYANKDAAGAFEQFQEIKILMPALAGLESQGEANFHPTTSVPASALFRGKEALLDGYDTKRLH